jgi:hypothetical protein
MIKQIIAGIIISSSLLLGSSSVELNINDNILEVLSDYSLNDVYNMSNNANYNLTLSYLKSQKDDLNTIIATGLKIQSPYVDELGLNIGFGVKLVFADNYNDSFKAIPFNIFIDYEINNNINLNINFSYSPKILSFSNANKYQEIQIKANYEVIDNGFLYIGKRDITTDYTDGTSIKFDDDIFFGFKVLF